MKYLVQVKDGAKWVDCIVSIRNAHCGGIDTLRVCIFDSRDAAEREIAERERVFGGEFPIAGCPIHRIVEI